MEQNTTDAVIKQIAQEAVETYHLRHCPAKEIGAKIDGVVKEFSAFRGEFIGQTKSIRFWVPIWVTIGMGLVGGICTLAFWIMTRKDVQHAEQVNERQAIQIAQEQWEDRHAN